MADIIYTDFLRAIGDKEINFNTDILKCALMTSAYTPLQSQITFNSISANEVSNGFGYSSGGVNVNGSIITSAAPIIQYDITDPAWLATGGTIGPTNYAVVYDASSNNQLIYNIDLSGSQLAVNAANFKIIIDPSGLFNIYQG